jgi:hypothetical protein
MKFNVCFPSCLCKRRIFTLRQACPDPAAMIEAVSGDPGTIGLLPSTWAAGELKTVRLDDPIMVPILALTLKNLKE